VLTVLIVEQLATAANLSLAFETSTLLQVLLQGATSRSSINTTLSKLLCSVVSGIFHAQDRIDSFSYLYEINSTYVYANVRRTQSHAPTGSGLSAAASSHKF